MAVSDARIKRRFSRIGIDLGTSHVKMVQFKKDGKKVALHRYGLLPLPEGTVEQGRIIDSGVLAGQLKSFTKQLCFEKKTANICIGNQSVILRSITLPKMSPKEIPEAIHWESEKHIMLPADEVTTDYVFDREITVDGKQVIEVKLVAAPREVIKGYIEVVAQAGLNPKVVEIEPLSLNRAVRFFSGNAAESDNADDKAPGMLLLIDIGSRCTNLLIMENGEYKFSRTLHIGVKDICGHVAASNNINMQEAAGLVMGSEPFSVPGFRDIANELAELINSSADYYIYRVREKDMNFNKVLLCGGGAAIKGLGSFLSGSSGKFELEPKAFNIFDYIECSNNNGISEKDKLLFGVAGGLALRGWAWMINEKGD